MTNKSIVNKWDVFSRLTVISEVFWYSRRKFSCECVCWNNWEFYLNALVRWNTKSCWCLHKEIITINWKKRLWGIYPHKWVGKNWEHITKHRLYSIYNWMINRCWNKNIDAYKYYWGRWITVEWVDFYSFESDMLSTYSEGLTIERIDVNGNYCKENCTWIKKSEQPKNRRSNNYISYDWETHTLSEWSRIKWINRTTLDQRINAYRWKIQKAFNY